MRHLFLAAVLTLSIAGTVAAPPPVAFALAWHLHQLGLLGFSTLVSHPVAVGVKTYVKTQGKDILKKPSYWTLIKAFVVGFTARRSWVRPYGKLWHVLHPDEKQTRKEALTLFVRKHKAFCVAAGLFAADALVILGLHIRHRRAQKAWEAEQKK